jgi:hypothetical protein
MKRVILLPLIIQAFILLLHSYGNHSISIIGFQRKYDVDISLFLQEYGLKYLT